MIDSIFNHSNDLPGTHFGAATTFMQFGPYHYSLNKITAVIIGDASVYKYSDFIKSKNWQENIILLSTDNFLPGDTGIKRVKIDNSECFFSTRERALLECMYLSPKLYIVEDVYLQMDLLWDEDVNIKRFQFLLEHCSSNKTKRMFRYFAQKSNWSWMSKLDYAKIDFGNETKCINITKEGESAVEKEEFGLIVSSEIDILDNMNSCFM